MKTAKIIFSDGDSITTGINGTDEKIKDYYKIGKTFNLGQGENDKMAQVVSVEIRKSNNCWNCFYDPANRTTEQGNSSSVLCYHPEWQLKEKGICYAAKVNGVPACFKEYTK